MKRRPPPPVVMIVGLAIIWLTDRYVAFGQIEFAYRTEVAAALILIGSIVVLMAILDFFKAKTTVDPLRPHKATALVENGIFKFSRNPMYLAMLIFLIAFCVGKGSLIAFLVPVFFVVYMNRVQIKAEEVALEKIFGDSYRGYRSRVRRWL